MDAKKSTMSLFGSGFDEELDTAAASSSGTGGTDGGAEANRGMKLGFRDVYSSGQTFGVLFKCRLEGCRLVALRRCLTCHKFETSLLKVRVLEIVF
jgi:hypothetical protein